MKGASDNYIVLYIIKNEKKCIPCVRAKKYLDNLGVRYVTKYAEDELDFLLWLTGGKSVVPVILNPLNGKVMIGCPLEYGEFKERVRSIL